MRKIGKIFVPVVIISLLILNLVAVAAPKIEEVKAYINYGINMKLNGKAFEPKESDGTSLRPIVYKDRTYLPVAALGKALDVAVNWDAATGTVIIGESNDKINQNNKFNYNSKEFNQSELENIFSKMNYITVDITKNEIRTEDYGIEPYGVSIMSFTYDTERPELGFKSPSGKLYYTDCKNKIEGKNYEFSVATSDYWTTVALPAEEGTWHVYYDKKTNAYIDYSIYK